MKPKLIILLILVMGIFSSSCYEIAGSMDKLQGEYFIASTTVFTQSHENHYDLLLVPFGSIVEPTGIMKKVSEELVLYEIVYDPDKTDIYDSRHLFYPKNELFQHNKCFIANIHLSGCSLPVDKLGTMYDGTYVIPRKSLFRVSAENISATGFQISSQYGHLSNIYGSTFLIMSEKDLCYQGTKNRYYLIVDNSNDKYSFEGNASAGFIGYSVQNYEEYSLEKTNYSAGTLFQGGGNDFEDPQYLFDESRIDIPRDSILVCMDSMNIGEVAYIFQIMHYNGSLETLDKDLAALIHRVRFVIPASQVVEKTELVEPAFYDYYSYNSLKGDEKFSVISDHTVIRFDLTSNPPAWATLEIGDEIECMGEKLDAAGWRWLKFRVSKVQSRDPGIWADVAPKVGDEFYLDEYQILEHLRLVR